MRHGRRPGLDRLPLAGAWLISLQLSTVSILGLLATPSVLCALGMMLMRKECQAH